MSNARRNTAERTKRVSLNGRRERVPQDINDELLLGLVQAQPGICSKDLFGTYEAIADAACRGTPSSPIRSRTGRQKRMQNLAEANYVDHKDIRGKRVWVPEERSP